MPPGTRKTHLVLLTRGKGDRGWWEQGGQGSREGWCRPRPDPHPPPPRSSHPKVSAAGHWLLILHPFPRPQPLPGSRYLLRQQRQCVPRLRGRWGGRLQKVVFGVGAGHGTVRATAVWLPPRDYHHPSGSGQWARLRAGGRRPWH